MNIRLLLATAGLSLLWAADVNAAEATATPSAYAVPAQEMRALNAGQSVKNDLLGKRIYNDKGEELGLIQDLLLTANQLRPFALVATDGFESIAKHDVVIPLDRLKTEGDRVVLTGATKDDLRALPEFRAKDSGVY